MKRYEITYYKAGRARVPFWKPWGCLGWLLRVAVFTASLLLFLLLFCIPPKEVMEEPVIHTGDVQVLLEWESIDDLDLHVTDPAGETIFFEHRNSASGGELDVDANASRLFLHPKENVYWPENGAPQGRYRVKVVLYNKRTEDATPFSVKVKYGEIEEQYEAVVSREKEEIFITDFTME